MRMFVTSKNKYLSNDMKIFGICSIPLRKFHIKNTGWTHKNNCMWSGGRGVLKFNCFHFQNDLSDIATIAFCNVYLSITWRFTSIK